MIRRHRLVVLALVIAVASVVPRVSAQAPPKTQEDFAREIQSLGWQRGPSDGAIGSTATLKLQKGQAFLDGPNTRRFLELNQNPPRDNRYTLASEEAGWFAIFWFEDSGYVKDDEKLDADALLKSLKDSDGPANDERKRLGMPPIHTVSWHVPPRYDPATKRLEWAVGLSGGGSDRVFVNYTTRLLGRRGVMHATLVSGPETLDRDIAEFKTALGDFTFIQGERYAEFKAGDRIAEYGLAALVLGGAAAVATKTGFGKALGKFVVIGVIAAGSAILALFRKFFRRG